MNKPQVKKITFGEHDLQNAAVLGLTRECGRTSCRHSGIIVVHKPHQLVQDLPLTPNSERRELRRLYSFYSLIPLFIHIGQIGFRPLDK